MSARSGSVLQPGVTPETEHRSGDVVHVRGATGRTVEPIGAELGRSTRCHEDTAIEPGGQERGQPRRFEPETGRECPLGIRTVDHVPPEVVRTREVDREPSAGFEEPPVGEAGGVPRIGRLVPLVGPVVGRRGTLSGSQQVVEVAGELRTGRPLLRCREDVIAVFGGERQPRPGAGTTSAGGAGEPVTDPGERERGQRRTEGGPSLRIERGMRTAVAREVIVGRERVAVPGAVLPVGGDRVDRGVPVIAGGVRAHAPG